MIRNAVLYLCLPGPSSRDDLPSSHTPERSRRSLAAGAESVGHDHVETGRKAAADAPVRHARRLAPGQFGNTRIAAERVKDLISGFETLEVHAP